MNRGQAHTMEAVAASLILLGGLVFALQSTVVTPLTDSTASQHVENQLSAEAEGLLEAAAEDGSLKETTLYWNNSGECFHDAEVCGSYGYTDGGPPTSFGESLNETFRDRNVAFNVNVMYLSQGGAISSEEMVRSGHPSDHAVTVRQTVTLTDDDRLIDRDGEKKDLQLEDADGFYAPNRAVNDSVYNVVQVEVVLWRM